MSDMARGYDADFDEQRLIKLYDSSLANRIGNLLNRTMVMLGKYAGGAVAGSPGVKARRPGEQTPSVFIEPKHFQEYKEVMESFFVNMGMEKVAVIAYYCNQLVDNSEPWKLARDKSQTTFLNEVLYTLAESLRIIAILISPVLPKAAHGIFDQLNWKMELSGKEGRFSLADAEWGKLPDGHVVGKPVPLFPRIETREAV
jgi:methionyl-tRNA synthetase